MDYHSLELGDYKQIRFWVSIGCSYVRKQQETEMVLTSCPSIRDALDRVYLGYCQ